jgi:hypothetical protein
MRDPLRDVDWSVRVSSLPQAIQEACDAAGLSPNAVIFHDLTLGGERPAAANASIDWPSYFCDKAGFVLVLAYLVRNHLPLEMDVRITRPSTGTSHFRMHPPLDPHAKAMLQAINPREAQAMADLNARAESVFARLRQAHLPDIDGRDLP